MARPPAPVTLPLTVSVLPAVSIVPPPVIRLTGRPTVKFAVACRVPPAKVSVAPAAPRAAS
ncbi:MAG TPA: hypothetical protein VFF19_04405 [Reyranella sp.]|nr:hypothetical protein [Reyranella sp.]